MMKLLSSAFLFLFLAISSNLASAAPTTTLLTCADDTDQTLTVTNDGQTLRISTESTYFFFDEIYRKLISSTHHIPGDMHNANITMTVPASSCEQTPSGSIECSLIPAGGTFETDVLGNRYGVSVQGLMIGKTAEKSHVTATLIRENKSVTATLEFANSFCKQ